MKESSGFNRRVYKILRHETKCEYIAAFQQYEAELNTILGVDKVTVKCLKAALRQRNLPLSGLKHEKAERLARYHRILLENPTAAQLACEYILDDDELGDEGSMGESTIHNDELGDES
jgi:hypothetical protein